MARKNKILLILSLSIFAILLLVSSIWDLQISIALADLTPGSYYSQNGFAIAGEVFGEKVMYLLFAFACAILFFNILQRAFKNRFLKFSLLSGFVLGGFFSVFYDTHKMFSRLENYAFLDLASFNNSFVGKLVQIFASLCVVALIMFLTSKIGSEKIKKLFRFAVAVLVVSVLSNAVVHLLKILAGRTRFRAMVFEGYTDYTYYTPWFSINKTQFASIFENSSDYFKSFPSGHACASASIFLLVLLCGELNLKKSWRITLNAISTCYTVLVCLSRIVAGAHFLSDVLFGAGITILCVAGANFVLKNLNKNKNLPKND